MHSNRPSFHSPTHKQTIIHYHYHYKDTSPASFASKNTQSMVNRIRSDQNLRRNLFSSNETVSESTYSPRSWKRFIKRQYQSNIDPKDRLFKGSAREEARQILKRQYKVRINEPYSTKQSQIMQIRVPQYEMKHFKNTGNRQDMLYSSSYFNNNRKFNENHYTAFDQNWMNPQARKSCITKDSEEKNQCTKMGIFTQRQQENAYRYSLLEQQCVFLRQKFLQHYVRSHQSKNHLY